MSQNELDRLAELKGKLDKNEFLSLEECQEYLNLTRKWDAENNKDRRFEEGR